LIIVCQRNRTDYQFQDNRISSRRLVSLVMMKISNMSQRQTKCPLVGRGVAHTSINIIGWCEEFAFQEVTRFY